MTIAESTANSTGTSLGLVCATKKVLAAHRYFRCFSKAKLQSMKLFGAEPEMIKSPDGKITPDFVPNMIKRVRERSEQNNFYRATQFENKDALEEYKLPGREIILQTEKRADVFASRRELREVHRRFR